MNPLAAALDVQERLGRALNSSEQLRVEALLRDASAAVRLRAGQQISAGTSTGVYLTRTVSGAILLPQQPVISVEQVTDVNGNAVSYQLVGDRLRTEGRLLNEFEIEPVRVPTNEVVVDYTHGYDPVPDDIVAVVCQMVARALGTPPDQGGIIQEGIDGYNYSIGSAAAAGGLGMLATELAVVDRYATPVPAISMWQ